MEAKQLCIQAFDSSLLSGPEGERNFEQARTIAHWQAESQQSDYDFGNLVTTLTRECGSTEAPLEGLVMRHYARRLMEQRNETHLETAWGDPFTSAEIYIQQVIANRPPHHPGNSGRPSLELNNSTSWEEIGIRKRRRAICFDPQQLASPLSKRTSTCPECPSSPEATRMPFENGHGNQNTSGIENNRPSEVDDLPPEAHVPRRVERHDRHLIDVSNVFVEEALRPLSQQQELLTTSSPTENCGGGGMNTQITQLFSPSQVRELLARQASSRSPLSPTCQAGVNPWTSKFTDLFWTKIAARVAKWSNYFVSDDLIPPKRFFSFGDQLYERVKSLSAGGHGKIWVVALRTQGESQVSTTVDHPPDSGGLMRVVKLQLCDMPLEFYYMREVRRRLASAFNCGKISFDVRPAICPVLAATCSPYVYTSLLMPYYAVGLLDWINYSANGNRGRSSAVQTRDRHPHRRPLVLEKSEEEVLSMYLAFELLWLVEGLHIHAGIIHGDIKPDNFRISGRFPLLDCATLDALSEEQQQMGPGVKEVDFGSSLMSGKSAKVLLLIDFGLCIDMARFPGDTVFKVGREVTKKRAFPCIEMLTGKPWTFQLDLFNIAGVIYTIVFKRYMKVDCSNGVWLPRFLPQSSRIYRGASIWRNIITTLLNIKSCSSEDYPHLAALRYELEVFLQEHATEYNLAAEKANSILTGLMP
uniref:Mitotic checkpoint serine/threonine-protein kinase BUB1 n=1 Tax=Schistocephalus solidus TaxID=70667 RepID=A0A0V0JAQ4_SCHSO